MYVYQVHVPCTFRFLHPDLTCFVLYVHVVVLSLLLFFLPSVYFFNCISFTASRSTHHPAQQHD